MAYTRERFVKNDVRLGELHLELAILKSDLQLRRNNASKIANLKIEIAELSKENDIIEQLIQVELQKNKVQDEKQIEFAIPDISFSINQNVLKVLISLFTILKSYHVLNRFYFSQDDLTIINNESNDYTDMALRIIFPKDTFSSYQVKTSLGLVIDTEYFLKVLKSFDTNSDELTIRISNHSVFVLSQVAEYYQVTRKFFINRVIYSDTDDIFTSINNFEFPCNISLNDNHINGFLLIPQSTKKIGKQSLIMINCQKNNVKFYSDLKSNPDTKEEYYDHKNYCTSIKTNFPLEIHTNHFGLDQFQETFLTTNERLTQIKNVIAEFKNNFTFQNMDLFIKQSQFSFYKASFKELSVEISLNSVDEDSYY